MSDSTAHATGSEGIATAPDELDNPRGWRLVVARLPTWGWLIFPVAIVFLLIQNDAYNLYLTGLVLVAALSALGLDWLMGRAGQVSLGNGALMAVGAYTTGILGERSWFLAQFPVPIVISAVAGAVIGWLVGLTASRLRGIYFALATLALQFIIQFAAQRYQSGSTLYQAGVPVAAPKIGGFTFSYGRSWVILLAVIFGAAALIVRQMLQANPGRMWMAIRENELAATTIGIDARRWKQSAFVGSSAMIAVAGALAAYYTTSVSADSFTLDFTLGFIVMVILGGQRSFSGVLLGATVVTVLPQLLGNAVGVGQDSGGFIGWISSNIAFIDNGIYGILVLVVLLFLPSGIVPSLGRIVRGLAADSGTRVGGATRGDAGERVQSPEHARVRAAPGEAGRHEAESTPLLEVRNLTVTYSNGARALDGVDLSLHDGQALALVGRNGAGKTSLLRSVTGFLRSEHVAVGGLLTMSGRDLLPMSPEERARFGIGIVPERNKAFADLTVREHLGHIGDADLVRDAMPEVLPLVERRGNSPAGLLSGGERQLLALALAASLRPRVLLIDEMSLGLAPIMIQRVAEAVAGLHDRLGCSVLIVEQNVVVAEALATQVLVLDSGRVVDAYGGSRPQPKIASIADPGTGHNA